MKTKLYIYMYCLFAFGCGDQRKGDLYVTWKIGPGTPCEEAGIETIEIKVRDKGGAMIKKQEASCESGGLTLKGLPEGIYEVEVIGQRKGKEIYSGVQEDVQVKAGEVTKVQEVRLSPSPASLFVEWSFSNGKLCAPNGVEKIKIIIWKGDIKEKEEILECETGQHTFEEIDPGTNYTIEIEGLDSSGTPTYSYKEKGIELSPGEKKTIGASLTPVT
jgi:hypothetical protein